MPSQGLDGIHSAYSGGLEVQPAFCVLRLWAFGQASVKIQAVALGCGYDPTGLCAVGCACSTRGQGTLHSGCGCLMGLVAGGFPRFHMLRRHVVVSVNLY